MTVATIAGHIGQLLKGDRDEWRHLPYRLSMKCRRIDLGWVSAEASGIADRERWHSSSAGPELEIVLNTLRISSSDSAIDFGCGKGGALLTMARYPFARVDGVELAPNLAEIGRSNIRKLRVSNASIFCCDAGHFTDVDIYTYVYMYNPFADSTVRQVLDNINQSLRRCPRRMTVIYKNPTCRDAMTDAGFQEIRTFNHCYPSFSIFAQSFDDSYLDDNQFLVDTDGKHS